MCTHHATFPSRCGYLAKKIFLNNNSLSSFNNFSFILQVEVILDFILFFILYLIANELAGKPT